jgi:hypothetical protein
MSWTRTSPTSWGDGWNFARFDARLEQRLAELRAERRQEIAELRPARSACTCGLSSF